jgi:hypothetical protein
MNISRSFMLVGVVFLVLGIPIGMYMGAANNFALAPLHAHLNLLGFVLMTIFGILYRIVPAMADSGLAKVHFWLHTIGVTGVFVMLFLLLTGRVSAEGMVPVAPASEGFVFVGILCYALNLLRNGE